MKLLSIVLPLYGSEIQKLCLIQFLLCSKISPPLTLPPESSLILLPLAFFRNIITQKKVSAERVDVPQTSNTQLLRKGWNSVFYSLFYKSKMKLSSPTG